MEVDSSRTMVITKSSLHIASRTDKAYNKCFLFWIWPHFLFCHERHFHYRRTWLVNILMPVVLCMCCSVYRQHFIPCMNFANSPLSFKTQLKRLLFLEGFSSSSAQFHAVCVAPASVYMSIRVISISSITADWPCGHRSHTTWFCSPSM